LRQSAIEFEVDGEAVKGIMAGPVKPAGKIPAVVVCHPHPLFGGTMDSPVVYAICHHLAESGIASLRFNFRRPGDGSPAVGDGAARDVATAFWVIQQWDHVNSKKCGAAGYSFGAAAILKSLDYLDAARALALVAPPINALKGSSIASDKRARQVIAGESDKLVRIDELKSTLAAMSRPPEIVGIPGADHFLAGHEGRVGDLVAQFMVRALR